MPYPEECPCGFEWEERSACDGQAFSSLLVAGEKRGVGGVVRVRGTYACRMYLRGWVIWWPGAQFLRERWLADEYRVSGDLQTFVSAVDGAGCRTE